MAINLTREQHAFLKHHGIGTDKVFDAEGLSKSQYRPLMKAGGFLIAANVAPCRKMGHTLRDRYGIRVACAPQSLAHAKRYLTHISSVVACTVDPRGLRSQVESLVRHPKQYEYQPPKLRMVVELACLKSQRSAGTSGFGREMCDLSSRSMP